MPWHVKPTQGYGRDTQEGQDNALMIASILTSYGWSLKGICAALGNMQGESGINPWRWEGDVVPTLQTANNWSPTELSNHGYGLFQYTWFTYYRDRAYDYPGFGINYSDVAGSDLDGQAQTLFMNYDIRLPQGQGDWSQLQGHYDSYYPYFIANGVDISTFYWITAQELIDGGNYTLEQLTGTFELCYERPRYDIAYNSYDFRCQTANYYYNYLSNIPIPPFSLDEASKWIYWLKPKWKRGF